MLDLRVIKGVLKCLQMKTFWVSPSNMFSLNEDCGRLLNNSWSGQGTLLMINVWTAVLPSSYMTLFNNSLHQANLSLYQIIRPTYTDECDQLENPEGVSCDGGDRYRRIDGRFCPNESFEVQYGCSTWDGIIVFKVQQLEKPILGRRQHRDEEIFERWVPRLTEYSHGLVEVLQNNHKEYLKTLIWIITSNF